VARPPSSSAMRPQITARRGLLLQYPTRPTGDAMKTSLTTALVSLLLTSSSGLCPEDAPKPLYPQYPSETPSKFAPVSDSWDYELRDVMIPMRDGVKLHTIIMIPKGASHAGILLTRTPYEAATLTSHTHSGHLGPMLQGYDN